ncbi:MAG TPA: hypothetical protein VFZ31_08650, partial [Vicinamibacterales bacterium]
ISTVAILAAALVLRPAAQTHSLDQVLKRSATYVAEFRKQLSGIVAEETYLQEVAGTERIGGGSGRARTLRSDLLLVKAADDDRYVELRDVFEVDGKPVRHRQARLERLLGENASTDRIGEIIAESARYNIGNVTRNINTPLMSLLFLDAANQSRFEFKQLANPAPVFKDAGNQPAPGATVFRVTTEMWTIEYRERRRNTIIKRPDGRDLPARGRFWIDPSNGAVLISELIVEGGGVLATVTVSYQSEPLMGFLVPVEMREVYIGTGMPSGAPAWDADGEARRSRRSERIAGRAEYGQFRRIAIK